MLEAYGEAISFLFQPLTLLLMLGAIIVGLIIGVIPGVGGMVFIALLLPMFFRVEAFIALTFLIALHAVVPTGGSISAILVGIPGSGPNAPTVFDGFPMNQKGQGARAIGAAVTSSAFGGFVPVVLALAMIPLVMPIVMSFRSPEMAILVNFPSSVHLKSPKEIYDQAGEILEQGGHTGRLQIQISENMPPGAWRKSFPEIVRAIRDFGPP